MILIMSSTKLPRPFSLAAELKKAISFNISTGQNNISTYARFGSAVVERLIRDWGAAGSSLTGFKMLFPWARHIYPCLVLVQPRKTRPDITEKLLANY